LGVISTALIYNKGQQTMDFYSHILNLLSQEDRFFDNGKLFKNKVVEAVLQMDRGLLSLLLNDNRAKKHFFKTVDQHLVFDKIKFQHFISNKAFLPNSYTAFKNKIGLTTGAAYLSKTNETVLDFPYKDCVLKGGQTKEDQPNSESFYHETLNAEEIDRLFEPKALTNFKKYDTKGEHIPSSLSQNDNLIIKGNNLLGLHSLKKNFTGKIKLIYIDPPYNTGNDSFHYNDSFSHSTWLTFMKNRLEVAWQLLKNDGTLFIQVDDGEFAYLKVLCDELFGRENFRESIVLKSSTESGVNAINVKRGERLFKVKEYILFYSKSPSFRFKPFYTKTNFNFNYKYEVLRENGTYKITDLSRKFKADYKTVDLPQKEKNVLIRQKFKNYALKHSSAIYSLEKNIKKAGAKFKAFAANNKKQGGVQTFINSKSEQKLIYDGGVLVPLKERIVEGEKENSFGVLASDLWTDIGTTPSTEGGVRFTNGKKPEKLLKRIIEMSTEKGDIVLDYHLGSGTTAAVAHKMQRQYIGLEQLDYGANDSIARLQKVIEGEQSGISKDVKWPGGGSFVYAELAKNNASLIEAVQATKNNKELHEIYNQLKHSAFVKYTVDFNSFDKALIDFERLPLNEQKSMLLELMDKNHLYINLAELQDASYNLSEKTIILNKSFYT
jgi:adenine-specific DNA-methyltransferase